MRRAGGLQFGDDLNISDLPSFEYFATLLITKIDWDATEIVKEKCTFACRGVSVKYRQQAHAGHGTKETGGMKLSLVKATS
ncbi:MAG TPA: hypothetical protein VFE41_01375 [Acetobacteraceae bacterium]|jgi:hypothetical protein|nr:hypothetical protein [Acetobacteraceae bacterium]